MREKLDKGIYSILNVTHGRRLKSMHAQDSTEPGAPMIGPRRGYQWGGCSNFLR